MPFPEAFVSDPVLSKDKLIRVLKTNGDTQKWTIERLRGQIHDLKKELADEKHSHALTCLSLQLLIDAPKGHITIPQTEFAKKEAFDRSIDNMPPLHIEGVG